MYYHKSLPGEKAIYTILCLYLCLSLYLCLDIIGGDICTTHLCHTYSYLYAHIRIALGG